MPSSAPRPRGFVLPTTLLVTTLLTVMLTAAFILVSAEYRTTDNSLATTRALTLAQAGLQNYFASNRGLSDTSTYDSLRYTLSGGYANVVARRLRASTTTALALWVVRSSGFSTDPLQPGQAQGQRVVAQLAQLNLGMLPARAAMVAANGVQMQVASGANPINGDDLGSQWPCIAPSSSAADTFGLSTYNGGYSGGGGSDPGGEGDNGKDLLANASLVIDSTRIDWASLLSGNFTPDRYVYPSSPASAWPGPNNTDYPVVYAPDSLPITIPPGGLRRGMLVARGDVLVQDYAHWDGVIVAGGRFDDTPGAPGNYRIHGMLITGLNISLGDAVNPNQVRRGSGRSIQWTWCYTRNATNSLSALVPLRNGWIDTWTTY